MKQNYSWKSQSYFVTKNCICENPETRKLTLCVCVLSNTYTQYGAWTQWAQDQESYAQSWLSSQAPILFVFTYIQTMASHLQVTKVKGYWGEKIFLPPQVPYS